MGNSSCVPEKRKRKGFGCTTDTSSFKPYPGECCGGQGRSEACITAAMVGDEAGKLHRFAKFWRYPSKARCDKRSEDYRRSDHGVQGRRVRYNIDKTGPLNSDIPEYSDGKIFQELYLPELVPQAIDDEERDRNTKARFLNRRRDDRMVQHQYQRDFQGRKNHRRASQKNVYYLGNSNYWLEEKRRYRATPFVPRRMPRVTTGQELPDRVRFAPSRVVAPSTTCPTLRVVHESPSSFIDDRNRNYTDRRNPTVNRRQVLCTNVKQLNHIYPPSIELAVNDNIISSSEARPRTTSSSNVDGIVRFGANREPRYTYPRDERTKYARDERSSYQQKEEEVMYQREESMYQRDREVVYRNEEGAKYQREEEAKYKMEEARYKMEKGAKYQREEEARYKIEKGAKYQREEGANYKREEAKYQREEGNRYHRDENGRYQSEERGRYKRVTIREPVEELEELHLARRANEVQMLRAGGLPPPMLY